VAGLIPVVGILAFALTPAAVIAGIVAVRRHSGGRKRAWWGIGLGVAGLVATFAWMAAINWSLDGTFSEFYGTDTAESGGGSQDQPLPFSSQFTLPSGVALSATPPQLWSPGREYFNLGRHVGYRTLASFTNTSAEPVTITPSVTNFFLDRTPCDVVEGSADEATLAPGQSATIDATIACYDTAGAQAVVVVSDGSDALTYFGGSVGLNPQG
jgi:hypothetical protein